MPISKRYRGLGVPRLVSGGIVVFDDYGSPVCDGLTKFANQEMAKPDRLMVYNLNGHGVFIKR